MWDAIGGLVKEIKTCEGAGASMAALSVCFVAMDTMSYLGMAADKTEQGRAEFIAWVDKYLRGHQDQPYKYRGIDVYAARCAVLHAYGSEAKLHRDNPDVVMFAYHDGGKHMFDPKQNKRLALIGLASFINDAVIAIESFVKVCRDDADLKKRVEERLPKILRNTPLTKS